jgi:ATP-dependent Clp protease ATP-binding subunit ClpC
MFERYTKTARRVIFFARYECSQYGSPTIDPQHLLLALTREARSLLQRVLDPDLSAQKIRTELEEFIPRGTRIATSVEVPLSEDAKKVLGLAVEECGRSGSGYLGPEHILMGIFLEGESPAARVLKRSGQDIAAVRKLLIV